MKLGLLISTYDAYRPVAEFTRRMIARYWPGHPPVFLCGCRAPGAGGYLPLRDDPRDWIGIMHSAVLHLLAEGFTHAYYIMDDCPPLGPCRARHLNQTLPALMERLGAAYLGLVGWDQRRGSAGAVLGRDAWHVQRQSAAFTWQFSTDPCCWNLEALRDLLAAMKPTDDPRSRTAWAFERRIGRTPDIVPERWRGTSYRICGYALLPWWRALPRRAAYRLHDLARWTARHAGGAAALARLDRSAEVETHFYDGPYPTYWQGVMAKGRFNENVRRYLWRRGRRAYLRELEESARQAEAAAGQPAAPGAEEAQQ